MILLESGERRAVTGSRRKNRRHPVQESIDTPPNARKEADRGRQGGFLTDLLPEPVSSDSSQKGPAADTLMHMMTTQDFQTAYQAHYPRTHRFLLSRGVTPSTAEEVAQAAWARGWERRDALRDDAKIGAWVNTIALNLLRRSAQRDKRHVELNTNIDRPTESSVPERMDAETLLAGVSEQDRSLLIMNTVEGRTSQEISEQTDLSPVAVRVRLCRAKARLRKRFTHRPSCRPRAKAASN